MPPPPPPPQTASPTCCNPSKPTLIPESDSSEKPFSPIRLTLLPRCLFKTKMRIPKRPTLSSFCLYLLSPPQFHSTHFLSRLHSSSLLCYRLSSRIIDPSSGKSKTRANCTVGGSWRKSWAKYLSVWKHNPQGSVFFRGSLKVHTMCTFERDGSDGNWWMFNVFRSNLLHACYTMDGTGVDDKTSQFQSTTFGDIDWDPCIWSSPGGGCKISIGKQIFCNRSLNMKNIVAVGFDMDYTLAQYKPETFESLAYGGTIRKLVYDLGYPPELLGWTFDWKYMVRGLVLDKKRGNILKMDRHKYVKVAYHGFRELLKEDKVAAYGSTLIREAFDEPDFALIDTLFSLAEAYLFAQLVDFKDNNPGKVPGGADYSRMYRDVRAAVDLCHRDGTLKQMVAKDPKRYINEDTSIVPMLKMLRDSGRATFLVTNSLWDYTNIVMNFLCGPQTMEGSNTPNFEWLRYFDVVITGSAKPSFFHDENRANLFEVEPESGMLLNTDNGTPMTQVGGALRLPLKSFNKGTRVFQGGNVGHLHKLLSIESSSQVLYVGDHIYGDILRSKKVLGWRTMLVVPELEKEVELLWELRDIRKQLRSLRNERDLIEDKIHHLKWSLKFDGLNDDENQKPSCELEKLESEREKVRLCHQEAQRELHQKFHKVWGQLMKTGYQNSRFAHQVERFACLYTSQVTNLSLYSPDKYYRPSEDFMPHEFDIVAL